MKVRYSPLAADDLQDINRFIAERSPAGARRVMIAIFAAIEFVKRHPDGAQPTSFPGIRAKLVPRYRFKMFYRVMVEEDVIEILHIRHTSRRPWLNENG